MYLTNKPDTRYIIFDIEANGLNPTKVWCVVAHDLETGNVSEFVGHDAIRRWVLEVANQENVVLVGHNSLSYDIPVLNRLLDGSIDFDRAVDTLVLVSLYDPHLDGKGLADFGERFGMPKLGHEEWDRFSVEMLARCRRDVEITVRLFKTIRDKMTRVGFSERSCWIEHWTRVVVDEQQRYGWKFDVEAAQALRASLAAAEAELVLEVHKQFPPVLKPVKTCIYKIRQDGTEGVRLQGHRAKFPKVVIDEKTGTYDCYDWIPFNLGSPQQRVERMLGIGYEPVNYTKKTKKGGGGNPQVDEDGLNAFLEDCPEEVKPAVKAMSEWLVVNSRINMIDGWLEAAADDGCIHGTVWTCGAGSRRCTHDNPNTANIPSGEAAYGHECRSFWRTRDGYCLVGCDAKAVQMRMFAHYLGNVEVGMQYVEGDPHQRNADAAAIPRKKVKNCFYAMIFGAQDPKLGKTGHGGAGTKEQGHAIRVALYQTTPGLEDLFRSADSAYYDGDGWMKCVDGGWVRCPSPHAALNYWIQSAEAILMKLTAIQMYHKIKKRGWDVHQVGFIHDELQYECPPALAEQVAAMFKETIMACGKLLQFIIPMEGDVKIGMSWSETH